MTFNMRYDNPEDGADNWRFRRGRVAEVIASHGVDVFGTQELLANQLGDLKRLLPGYAAVGVGREDGAEAGAASHITRPITAAKARAVISHGRRVRNLDLPVVGVMVLLQA